MADSSVGSLSTDHHGVDHMGANAGRAGADDTDTSRLVTTPAVLDYLFPETVKLDGLDVPLSTLFEDGKPIGHDLLNRIATTYELEGADAADAGLSKHMSRLRDLHNKRMAEPIQARLLILEGELAANKPSREIIRQAERSDSSSTSALAPSGLTARPFAFRNGGAPIREVMPSAAIDPHRGVTFARSFRGIYDDPSETGVKHVRRPMTTEGTGTPRSTLAATLPALRSPHLGDRPSTAAAATASARSRGSTSGINNSSDDPPTAQIYFPAFPGFQPLTSPRRHKKPTIAIPETESSSAHETKSIHARSEEDPKLTPPSQLPAESAVTTEQDLVQVAAEDFRQSNSDMVSGSLAPNGPDYATVDSSNTRPEAAVSTDEVDAVRHNAPKKLTVTIPPSSPKHHTAASFAHSPRSLPKPEGGSQSQDIRPKTGDPALLVPQRVRRRLALEGASYSAAATAALSLASGESLQPLAKLTMCPPMARGLPSSRDGATFNRLGLALTASEGRLPASGPVSGAVGGGSSHVDGPGVTLPPPLHSSISTSAIQAIVDYNVWNQKDALYPAPRLLAHPAAAYALTAAPPRSGTAAVTSTSNHVASATASSSLQRRARSAKTPSSKTQSSEPTRSSSPSTTSSTAVAAAAAAAAKASSTGVAAAAAAAVAAGARSAAALGASALIADAVAAAAREPGFENSGIGSGAAAVTGSITVTLRGTNPLGGGPAAWTGPTNTTTNHTGPRTVPHLLEKKDNDTTRLATGILPLLNSAAPIATARKVIVAAQASNSSPSESSESESSDDEPEATTNVAENNSETTPTPEDSAPKPQPTQSPRRPKPVSTQKTKKRKTVILSNRIISQPRRTVGETAATKREAFEDRVRQIQLKFHNQAEYSQSLHRIIRPLAGVASESSRSGNSTLNILMREPKMPPVVGGIAYAAPGTAGQGGSAGPSEAGMAQKQHEAFSQQHDSALSETLLANEGVLERRSLRAERAESVIVPKLDQLLRPNTMRPSVFDQAALAAGGPRTKESMARHADAASRARAGIFPPSSSQSALVPRCLGVPHFGEPAALPRAKITRRVLQGKVVNISKLLLSGQSVEAKQLAIRRRGLRTADDPDLGPGKHNLPSPKPGPCPVVMRVAATRVEEVASRGRVTLAAAAAAAASSTWSSGSIPIGAEPGAGRSKSPAKSTVPVRVDLAQVLRADAARAKVVKAKAAQRAALMVSKMRLADEELALENLRLATKASKTRTKRTKRTKKLVVDKPRSQDDAAEEKEARIAARARLAKRAMLAGHARAQLQRRNVGTVTRDTVDAVDDDEEILADIAGLTTAEDSLALTKSGAEPTPKQTGSTSNSQQDADSATMQDQIVTQLLTDPADLKVAGQPLRSDHAAGSILPLSHGDPSAKHVPSAVFWKAPGRGQTDHDVRIRSAGSRSGADSVVVPANVIRALESYRKESELAGKVTTGSIIQSLTSSDAKVPDDMTSSRRSLSLASGPVLSKTESLFASPSVNQLGARSTAANLAQREAQLRIAQQDAAVDRLSRTQTLSSVSALTGGGVASESAAMAAAAAHSLVQHNSPAYSFPIAPREVTSQDILTAKMLATSGAASEHRALVALVPSAIDSTVSELPEYHGRPLCWIRAREVELGCVLPHSKHVPGSSSPEKRKARTASEDGRLSASISPRSKLRPVPAEQTKMVLDIRARSPLECLGVKGVYGTYIDMERKEDTSEADTEDLVLQREASRETSFVAANAERVGTGLYAPTTRAVLLAAKSALHRQKLEAVQANRNRMMASGMLNMTQLRKRLQQKAWLTILSAIGIYKKVDQDILLGGVPELDVYRKRYKAVSVIESFVKKRNLARIMKANAEAKAKLVRFVHICRERRRAKAAKLLVSFFVDVFNTEFETIPPEQPAGTSDTAENTSSAAESPTNQVVEATPGVPMFPKLRKVRVLTVVNIVREYKRKMQQIQRCYRAFRTRVLQRSDLQLLWWKTLVQFARRCALGEEMWAACLTVEDDLVSELVAADPSLLPNSSNDPAKSSNVFVRLTSQPTQGKQNPALTRPWDQIVRDSWPNSDQSLGSQVRAQKLAFESAAVPLKGKLREELFSHFIANAQLDPQDPVVARTVSNAIDALLKDEDSLIAELSPRAIRTLSTLSVLSLRSMPDGVLVSVHLACRAHARFKSLMKIHSAQLDRQYQQQLLIHHTQGSSKGSVIKYPSTSEVLEIARNNVEQSRVPADALDKLREEETDNEMSILVARRLLALESLMTDEERAAYIHTNYRQRRRLYMRELTRYNQAKEAYIQQCKDNSDFATVLKPIIDARPKGVSQAEALSKHFAAEFEAMHKAPRMHVFLPPYHMILFINSCVRDRLARNVREAAAILSYDEHNQDVIMDVARGITSPAAAVAASMEIDAPSAAPSLSRRRSTLTLGSTTTPSKAEVAKHTRTPTQTRMPSLVLSNTGSTGSSNASIGKQDDRRQVVPATSSGPSVATQNTTASTPTLQASRTGTSKADVKEASTSKEEDKDLSSVDLKKEFLDGSTRRVESYDPLSHMYDYPYAVGASSQGSPHDQPLAAPKDVPSPYLLVDPLSTTSSKQRSAQQQDWMLQQLQAKVTDALSLQRAQTIQRAVQAIETLPNSVASLRRATTIKMGFMDMLHRLVTKDFERKAKDGLLDALTDLKMLDLDDGSHSGAAGSKDENLARNALETLSKYEHKTWLKEIMKEVASLSESDATKRKPTRRISRVLALRLMNNSSVPANAENAQTLTSNMLQDAKQLSGPASIFRDPRPPNSPVSTESKHEAVSELRLRPRRVSIHHSTVIAPLHLDPQSPNGQSTPPSLHSPVASSLHDGSHPSGATPLSPSDGSRFGPSPFVPTESLPNLDRVKSGSLQMQTLGSPRGSAITSEKLISEALPTRRRRSLSPEGTSPSASPRMAGSGVRSLFDKGSVNSPKLGSIPDFAQIPDQPSYSLATLQANAERRMAQWEAFDRDQAAAAIERLSSLPIPTTSSDE